MPKHVPWKSNITEVGKNKLLTREVDQEEIIRNFSYEEMVFLLIFGRKPTETEADLLRAVIVSHVSHGITGQSTIAVRMGADCRSPFLNSALGGFLVGSGGVHQGALQKSMEMLTEAAEVGSVEQWVENRLKARETFYGYGHRFHSKDPRAIILMKLCNKRGFVGKHVHAAREIERVIGTTRGRYMNIEAAGGSILLDLGFPSEVASLIILVGRGPMYAAVYLERLLSESKPFQRLAVYDIVPGKEEK
ncbi:MAG TPA: citrate/2-methylcitrate synthase [Candidatus Paceibacterota bacterium]|jgi:citrate synthase